MLIVAEAGDNAKWSSGPAFTVNVALLVLPPLLPVTVCAPAFVAVQVAPVQEPSGAIVNVVEPVTSPSELFEASNACAVYACDPPAEIDADAGLITMWSTDAASIVSVAVPVAPTEVPVTVWVPPAVAVQAAPLHEPSGAIVKVVFAVTLPSELFEASKPCAI